MMEGTSEMTPILVGETSNQAVWLEYIQAHNDRDLDKIAEINADDHDVSIDFSRQDFLVDDNLNFSVDCLVSNPPYIGRGEINTMTANTKYEPEIALFPKDDDPMIFYRKIAEKGRTLLKPDGNVYVEINENYHTQTKDIFVSTGYTKVEIIKDLNNKHRIIKAVK